MVSQALTVVALAAPLLLVPQEAGGYMLPWQFHQARQEFFSPANYGGVDALYFLRFGGKIAPAVLMAGSLPGAASATTAGSSISSSAQQPTSAGDVGLGSDETCDPEDADCQGDDTDEITFSMMYWIRTLFVWYSVARTAIVAIMYIAGTATSMFVAIRRVFLSGPRSGGGGDGASASWSVRRVLGGLIRGGGGGGRGTSGARTAGPRALRGDAPAAAAPSAVILVPTVFPAAGATSTAGSTAANSPLPATMSAIAPAPVGGAPTTTTTTTTTSTGGRVLARLSRAISNPDRFLPSAPEIMDDVLVGGENL